MASSVTEEARKKANLRVLQRFDPAVLDIVGSASHVVLYEFLQDAWTKSNVEGSLFLVKRSQAPPRFQLVILNRASVDNWSLPLTPTFQMQHEAAPFLIFRLKQDNQVMIRGIWFHDETERLAMYSLLERVVESLQHVEDLEKKHKPLEELATTTTIEKPQEAAAAQAETNQVPLLSPLSLNDKAPSETPPQQQVDQKQPQQQVDPLVLDKKSLQLSLLSLIQDERFLDLIHAQYLKVAHARANRGSKSPSASKK